MNRPSQLLAAVLLCGIAMAAGLAGHRRTAVTPVLAQTPAVGSTLVDTGFDADPVGSLPDPFLPEPTLSHAWQPWQPCTTQTVQVSDDVSFSGSKSLKVQHGCTSGESLSASGWTLPIPQYAPISRVHLVMHRMMADHLGRSYLGIPDSYSGFGSFVEFSSGSLHFLSGITDRDPFGTYTIGEFMKVEIIWDFVNNDLLVLIDDEPAYEGSVHLHPNQVTGFATFPTTFYDDDVTLTVEYASSPTVVIDGCDTGVPNHSLEGGGTIFDLVMECAVGAATHGEFTSCVTHHGNALKKSGIITGSQKGAIQSCAAQANIP
jgi:hypothetical protein